MVRRGCRSASWGFRLDREVLWLLHHQEPTAMRHGSTKLAWRPGMLIASVLALVLQLAGATPSSSQTASASPPGASCPGDNGGITLPKGFCATIFADGIGHAKGGFWPLHCVTAGDMEKRQITRQELVAAALKLGARPGTSGNGSTEPFRIAGR